MRYFYLLFVLSFHSFSVQAKEAGSISETFRTATVERSKKAVVTIKVSAPIAAYGHGQAKWQGTGFVVDQKKGLILTNAHVAGRTAVGTYELTFYNGAQTEAQLLYYDPWLDYAFLKADPKALPSSVTQVNFSAKDPVIDQPIFIIGNNEGQSFSTHTGNVNGLYTVAGALPQHTIRLSLNTTGGSSGSPICNARGEAVGLNYGGGQTHAFALHPAYLRYALKALRQGRPPKRQHIGAILGTYSLADAAKYRHFSFTPKERTAYDKQFPEARSGALQVVRTLKGSPADGVLLPGDIVWSINGRQIGPNLITFDALLNQTPEGSPVSLKVFRSGKWVQLSLLPYNPNQHQVNRMVAFNGAIFFEADDYWAHVLGLPAKTLTVARTIEGAAFANSHRFFCKIERFDDKPVKNLDDLVALVPALVKKKYFAVDFCNVAPVDLWDRCWTFDRGLDKLDVMYDGNLRPPTHYVFNVKSHTWKTKLITAPQDTK